MRNVYSYHCPIANRIQWLFRFSWRFSVGFFCIFFFFWECFFSLFSFILWNHTHKICMEARTLNIFCLYTWITNETNDFQPFPYNIIELNTLSDALLYESRVYNCVANNYGSRPNMQLETYARHNVSFALFLCVCGDDVFFAVSFNFIELQEIRIANWKTKLIKTK